jgi:alpha-glucosidase
LRNAHPELRIGACKVLRADEKCLVLERSLGDQSILCLFNLSGRSVEWPAEAGAGGTEIETVNGATVGELPPYGAVLIGR